MTFNYETGWTCLAHADEKRSNESRGLGPWAFQHLENEESEKKPEKEQPANSNKPMNKQTKNETKQEMCSFRRQERQVIQEGEGK